MNEEAAAFPYLFDYLGEDTTMRNLINGVWSRTVPQSAPMPAIKIDVLERSDVMVIGLHRIWADMLLLVRGIAEDQSGFGSQADWSEAQSIADQIDTMLHDHEGVGDVIAVHSFREEPFTDETVEGGKEYLHAGGIYRFRARAV